MGTGKTAASAEHRGKASRKPAITRKLLLMHLL